MGGATVIIDTGEPPPTDVSGRAHAGCLSFEMSSGRHNFIVNCRRRHLRRAPNSGRWRAPPPRIRPRRSTTPPRPLQRFARRQCAARCAAGRRPKARALRTARQARRRTASSPVHDGYVSRFGLYHERELTLSDGGNCSPASTLLPPAASRTRATAATRRDPLPPPSRRRALQRRARTGSCCAAPGTDVWEFACIGVEPPVEEVDLLRRAERSAQVAPDRARLQGSTSSPELPAGTLTTAPDRICKKVRPRGEAV